ncbi:MAG: hypothetical protein EOP56_15210 [Sphingobacteriales bacterium]|nr:MAG: hypothetical protein EOP56_15210 [Sphingobacteriales bacterium]
MKYLIILALTLMAANVQAQDTIQPYRYSAKVYAHIQYQRDANPVFSTSQALVKPAYAFQMKTAKGNAHEFELFNFMLNANKSGSPGNIYKTRATSIVLKYEYIINMMKKRNSKLAPAIGLGAAPYFYHTRGIPTASSHFPYRNSSFGFSGLLIPRVTYNVTTRLYLDVNIPITILDMDHRSNKFSDPTLPVAQRTSSLTSFNMLPSQPFTARIGLGIRF